MSIRLAALVMIPALLIAVVLALYGVQREPDATAAMSRAPAAPLVPVGEALPLENESALPPNHPPIAAATSPHATMASAASEAPALVWKMPGAWQEAPNPNAMRLATYRVQGGVEVSVSRAGGSTEANIERWLGQFDDVGHEVRAEKTVHGLRVVTIDVAGTYAAGGMGGMNAAGPVESKPGWALVGAVVESSPPSYFFKMTGPAPAVRAARPVFDRLVDSITPT